MSKLSQENTVKAEEEGNLVAIEYHPEVDDWRLSLVHLLGWRGLLVLLLLLEHHSWILALVKLLWVRRRGLAEVPATAGRGCHHGDVDVLRFFLFLTATILKGRVLYLRLKVALLSTTQNGRPEGDALRHLVVLRGPAHDRFERGTGYGLRALLYNRESVRGRRDQGL